ncbi:MAG: aldo/keto reductase [Acidimicrobiales bacterium]|nr:aldo/keto reductase [Acidimicrobiales bacterium]
MRYRSLGTTGVKVSNLCLGAMNFAHGNEDEGVAVITKALDEGINFVDTADVYSAGQSEQVVAKALKGRRDEVVLATKFHGPMGEDPNQRGNSRRWIVQEVDNSLRRLDTDRIDLYQVHRPDPATDIDDTLSALSDLVHQGKILTLGSSTFPAEQIVEAQWVAEKRGHERFRVEQPPYSIFVRGIESSVLPTAERYGMGVIPWSPLNGGFLTGRYRPGEDVPAEGRAARQPERFNPEHAGVSRKLDLIPELEKVAADAGLTLPHLALGFVLAHPAISSAIIGPRTMEQFEGVLGAGEVVLDDATLDRIDELVPPGANLNPADAGWQSPAVAQPWRRRRPLGAR